MDSANLLAHSLSPGKKTLKQKASILPIHLTLTDPIVVIDRTLREEATQQLERFAQENYVRRNKWH